jgi:predicted Co/Zn/Cd cation transporter (cation efflux family)
MLFALTLQLSKELFCLCLLYSFYKCVFDAVNGGEMTPKEYVWFMKLKNEHC